MAAIKRALEDLRGHTELLPGLWIEEQFIPRIGNPEKPLDAVQVGNWPIYVCRADDDGMGSLTILDTLRSRQESTDFDSRATSEGVIKTSLDAVPYFDGRRAASMRFVLDPAQDHDQPSQDLLELISVLEKNHPDVIVRMIQGPMSFE